MKYGNKPTEVNGIRFASKHEALRYVELQYLLRTGEIKDLRLQVPFELIPKQMEHGKCVERAVKYVADFVYEDQNGNLIVEDAKGFRTDVFRLKKKLFRSVYGIGIREV